HAPQGGFLTTTQSESLVSVFPSTTAVALTSLATATWPADHGLTGWFTYFPEHRRVIAPLLFTERGTKLDAHSLGLTPADLVSAEPVIGSFFRTVRSFLPAQIASGAFARWSRAGTRISAYRGFSHAARAIRRHYRRAPGPTYSYLYLTTVDSYCHEYGTQSEEVAREVARVDRLLATIRDSLPASVRMIVTADHGLVDVPEENHYVFRNDDPLA
ncbi:MAG: alkaline phosphatase family protein, partial [Spirochaetota bacterium]